MHCLRYICTKSADRPLTHKSYRLCIRDCVHHIQHIVDNTKTKLNRFSNNIGHLLPTIEKGVTSMRPTSSAFYLHALFCCRNCTALLSWQRLLLVKFLHIVFCLLKAPLCVTHTYTTFSEAREREVPRGSRYKSLSQRKHMKRSYAICCVVIRVVFIALYYQYIAKFHTNYSCDLYTIRILIVRKLCCLTFVYNSNNTCKAITLPPVPILPVR